MRRLPRSRVFNIFELLMGVFFKTGYICGGLLSKDRNLRPPLNFNIKLINVTVFPDLDVSDSSSLYFGIKWQEPLKYQSSNNPNHHSQHG